MRRRVAHCVTIEEVPEVEEQQPGSLENPLETEEFRVAWARQAAATDREEALEKAIQEETLYQDPDEGAVVDQALEYPQENHLAHQHPVTHTSLHQPQLLRKRNESERGMLRHS